MSPKETSSATSRFGNGLPKTQVVKSLGFGVEAFDDIAQTIAPSQLSEDHANQLLVHSEMPHARLGMKARSQTGEDFAMNQIEDLGENKSTGYHTFIIAAYVPYEFTEYRRVKINYYTFFINI